MGACPGMLTATIMATATPIMLRTTPGMLTARCSLPSLAGP